MVIDPVVESLFNDVDAPQGTEFAKVCRPHSMNAVKSEVSQPLWADPALLGCRVALKTMLDRTFPPPLQDLFIQNSHVDWQIVEIAAGYVGPSLRNNVPMILRTFEMLHTSPCIYQW
jgi:hypothetical protein